MSELDEGIPPFTVKDALHHHDRRINALSDEVKEKSHETQTVVRRFEEQMQTLIERINKGVSPTMQDIKEKSHDIEKQIISLKGDMNLRFSEVAKAMEVTEVETRLKFDSVKAEMNSRFQSSDELVSGFKAVFWKVASWAVVGSITAMLGMYIYIQQIKSAVASIPAMIDVKPKK